MINRFNQSRSTMILDGNNACKSGQSNKKCLLFYMIIFLYFFFGKWKVFTFFHISTDYLFWGVIAAVLAIIVFIERKKQVSISMLPFLIYLGYQFIEMERSSYMTTARPTFIFNVLTIFTFFYVKNRKGHERYFIKCLYIGGIYYSFSVVIQSVFPDFLNKVSENLLVDADVAFGLRGYENSTRYLAGLAPNAAISAFFIAMMVAICFAQIVLDDNRLKNIIYFIIGIISLLLTQKRSLALGIFLSIIIVYLLFRKGIARRFRFLMILLIVGSVSLYVMYRIMPAMTIFMNRLFHNEDVMSGRSGMYSIMETWFQSNQMLGVGIGTANSIFGYGGHNCYQQLLGEEGIIGCLIYGVMIIPYIVSLLKKLKICWNAQEMGRNTAILLSASICVVTILIYALVGNPFYDFTFCLTFFMLLAISTQVDIEE